MKWRLLTAVVLCFSMLANAAELESEKLPVRRVVLYKNGIGYFEHNGRVRGDQELKIEFTSAQLNDVLKSLTVLDLNGGKITGVGYNSVAPISEQLKSLRLPLGEEVTLADFLGALRGSKVQVRNGSTLVSGRLLGVEAKTVKKDKDEETTQLELSVITDAGEVRTFPLTPALGLRIADRDLSEEISRYLTLVGSARDQDLRRMNISTSGTGERNVFVSYVSEVPVWKSTYRILLPGKADAKPLLQGWAIVDNTVGEDWKNVELSLVAGAPQSFIQDLSKPYYTRRPVVGLPETAMLTPQTHEGTMELDKLALMTPGEAAAPVSPPPAKPGNSQFNRLETFAKLNSPTKVRTKSGTNQKDEEINGTDNNDYSPEFGSSGGALVNIASRGDGFTSGANAQDLGDLFEYNLKEKVTILKNHSALVPIVNTRIDAEKVTLWSRSTGRPLRALWITNSSDLTLDSGSFNVIENNAFAGEGLIDPLKPKEKRLVSYAIDQGVRVENKDDMENRPATHIKVVDGVMIQTSELRDHQVYTVRNADAEEREVIIEHPVRNGWKLAATLKPEETSASHYRFRVKVPAGETATLKVDEVQPTSRTLALSELSDNQIRLFFNDKTLKPELEQALRKIVEQKNQIAGYDQSLQNHQQEISSINQDQQRLRENMKALKGSVEEKALLQRYTRELNDQEDKLQTVRSEIAKLESERKDGREQLTKMVLQLNLDEEI